jgi:chromosome segregation ATPase
MSEVEKTIEKLNLQLKGTNANVQAIRQALAESTDSNVVLRTNLLLFQQAHQEAIEKLANTQKMLEVAQAETTRLFNEINALRNKYENAASETIDAA